MKRIYQLLFLGLFTGLFPVSSCDDCGGFSIYTSYEALQVYYRVNNGEREFSLPDTLNASGLFIFWQVNLISETVSVNSCKPSFTPSSYACSPGEIQIEEITKLDVVTMHDLNLGVIQLSAGQSLDWIILAEGKPLQGFDFTKKWNLDFWEFYLGNGYVLMPEQKLQLKFMFELSDGRTLETQTQLLYLN